MCTSSVVTTLFLPLHQAIGETEPEAGVLLPLEETQPCVISRPHGHIPSWLEPGTADWKKQAVRVGTQELQLRRTIYLNGFTDRRGGLWCGQCFWRCRLVHLGDQLGYPALDLVGLAAGYDAWQRYAKEAGVVGVEDAVRAAGRLEPQ